MKKFINDPENLTSELLEGLALANKDIIHLEDGNLVVNNKLKDAMKKNKKLNNITVFMIDNKSFNLLS